MNFRILFSHIIGKRQCRLDAFFTTLFKLPRSHSDWKEKINITIECHKGSEERVKAEILRLGGKVHDVIPEIVSAELSAEKVEELSFFPDVREINKEGYYMHCKVSA